MPRKIFIPVFVLCFFLSILCIPDPLPEEVLKAPLQKMPAVATNGMISTAHPLATQVGLDILDAHGNAFDAAVAVAAALNVVEPMNSGIGGYGTILIYDAEEKTVRFLDSSGKIPVSVDSDLFRPPTPGYKENRRGAKAVSTPGNVNAWWALSAEYGNLGWEELFKGAIRLAEDGFAVNRSLAAAIRYAFIEFDDYAQSIYGTQGKPIEAGALLIQRDLANSLRIIAKRGAKAVYGGPLGKAIDKAMRENQGFLSLSDLTSDRAEWWEPIQIEYRGFSVMTASPPSTAFPSLIRLGLMSRFDNMSLGHNSAEFLHRFAEATKHAFWCRLAYAGDPEINPPPIDKLLSEEYWDDWVKNVDMTRAKPFEPPRVVIEKGQHTTHFVVADKWGNVVSATQTLGNSFGSRILVKKTGIWLNNSLAYCTFEPKGNPMDAHAGHRKLSGDCPTIIFKAGRPVAALGTPGGHSIGQTVPQMVMNFIDFKMNIHEAIAAPRISFAEPDLLLVESAVPVSVRKDLEKRGHKLRIVSGLGNAHGLTLEYGTDGRPARFTGAADPRGRGLAKGY